MNDDTTEASTLYKWITPDETAAAFFLRQYREAVPTGLPCVDCHVTLRPGHVLEVVGPPGTAKTEMLIEVAANIMTKTPATVAGQQPEQQEHVVVIDCDGKFDTVRLLQVAGNRLPAAAVPSQSLDMWESMLGRLHLVRCFSSMELLLALNSLPRYLSSIQGRCCLLLVDNIAAFTWQDKAAAPAVASSGYAPHSSSAFSTTAYSTPASAGAAGAGVQHAAVATLLTELSQQLRCPVIVTKEAAVSMDERPDGTRLSQRELMLPAWQNAVTHRLLLSRTVPAGQVLASGPEPTEVVMQWQAPGYTGTVERCRVTPTAIVRC